MKNKFKKTLSFLLSCSIIVGACTVFMQKAEAKKMASLSNKKITITVKKTKVISLKNASKATWKIVSGKKVVKITKKSKKKVTVKALKTGTAKLQAKVGGKKLYCKITVKKAASVKPTAKPTKAPVDEKVLKAAGWDKNDEDQYEQTEESTGLTYSINQDFQGISVNGYDESAAEVTIPSKFGGYRVTGIVNGAFKNCDSLTIHCPVGSKAEAYAKDYHMKYDNNMSAN